MSYPLIEARQLSCERGDRLLFDDLSLTLREGSLIQVKGPNGAGKTTLLRIIAGLHDFYEGKLEWRGQPLRRVRSEYLRNLLYIGHRPAIKPRLTPMENLSALAGLTGQHTDDLERALEAVELLPFAHTVSEHLSAGQQRRIALARLYLSHHRIWILDEAFTAIDQEGVAALERMLVERVAAGGAVLMTTHHRLEVPGLETLTLSVSDQEWDL